MKNKKLFFGVLFIGFVAVLITALFRFGVIKIPDKVNIITSSTLKKSTDIAELSSAEFRYKGIASVYEDAERTRERCKVCYSAIVEAGIDMNKVDYEIDHESKTIIAKLPEIELKVNILDNEPMAFLPSGVDVKPDQILKYSKEDVVREANESTELRKVAQENVESVFRALLFPILNSQGYDTLEFWWGNLTPEEGV